MLLLMLMLLLYLEPFALVFLVPFFLALPFVLTFLNLVFLATCGLTVLMTLLPRAIHHSYRHQPAARRL